MGAGGSSATGVSGFLPGSLAFVVGKSQQENREVHLLTLTAKTSGATLQLCTFGATVVSLRLPDREGKLEDVLLGFDNLAAYEQHQTYIGCAVGRVCSRISGAKIQIRDAVYTLPQNNGAACHHGGHEGFSARVWDVREATPHSATLRLRSPHLDQGFPGNLEVDVEYALLDTDDGGTALAFRFRAQTDQTTVVNLTNHMYFNLAGLGEDMPEKTNKHVVSIAADRFVPTDEENIPLGELWEVDATPFDFRVPTAIGDRIDEDNDQLRIAQGYDHNMALRETPGYQSKDRGGPRCLGVEASTPLTRTRAPDATAEYPPNGRRMELFTSEPAVHFYSGNYLGNDPMGKGGAAISRRAGFCFETQHFTDSPNQPNFASVVLEPGERWETATVFWFPPPSAAAAVAAAA